MHLLVAPLSACSVLRTQNALFSPTLAYSNDILIEVHSDTSSAGQDEADRGFWCVVRRCNRRCNSRCHRRCNRLVRRPSSPVYLRCAGCIREELIRSCLSPPTLRSELRSMVNPVRSQAVTRHPTPAFRRQLVGSSARVPPRPFRRMCAPRRPLDGLLCDAVLSQLVPHREQSRARSW